ncbi:hypothetical protein B0H67DRAFT_682768 [Lasiosphaeris hirsuta]|uniref:Uncharacterized protein n=1 Tax=Lasiosphaeris hirsuta TaxID=260670 RepID=A0AA40AS10_9PEZI|nr:hypothetical protein B0H67DRAFT_682768 [Lasiosphaeris hirsuta]
MDGLGFTQANNVPCVKWPDPQVFRQFIRVNPYVLCPQEHIDAHPCHQHKPNPTPPPMNPNARHRPRGPPSPPPEPRPRRGAQQPPNLRPAGPQSVPENARPSAAGPSYSFAAYDPPRPEQQVRHPYYYHQAYTTHVATSYHQPLLPPPRSQFCHAYSQYCHTYSQYWGYQQTRYYGWSLVASPPAAPPAASHHWTRKYQTMVQEIHEEIALLYQHLNTVKVLSVEVSHVATGLKAQCQELEQQLRSEAVDNGLAHDYDHLMALISHFQHQLADLKADIDAESEADAESQSDAGSEFRWGNEAVQAVSPVLRPLGVSVEDATDQLEPRTRY